MGGSYIYGIVLLIMLVLAAVVVVALVIVKLLIRVERKVIDPKPDLPDVPEARIITRRP